MSEHQHYRAPPLPRFNPANHLDHQLQQPHQNQQQQQQQQAYFQPSTSTSYYPNAFASTSTTTSPENNEDELESKSSTRKGNRGAVSVPGTASSTGKRKERVHYSCVECHRRKQKCIRPDKEAPCQNCVARKVPELCKSFKPGDDSTDLATRMRRLENMMDDGFRHLFDRLDSITSQVAFQSQVQAESAHYQRELQRSFIPNPSNPQQTRRQNVREEDPGDSDSENGGADDRLSPETGAFIGSASVGVKAVENRMGPLLNELPMTGSIYDPVRPQLPASIDDAMKEFGSNGPSSLLLEDLPPKETIQALLDHFFREINWLRQPLPEKSLRHSFEVMLKADPILTPQTVNLFGIMMGIFSIAALSADESLFPDGPRSRRFKARKWHTATRRALFVSSVLGADHLEHVVCLNLATRFLLLDKRISESWTLAASAVKASHAIGLHREPKLLGLGEKESELRRRVWSAVYFGDRVLCATLGRPTSIDDSVTDTLPPSDIDEESDAPPPPPHILSKFPPGVKPPTLLTHTSQRHQLAVLMGKIISVFQNVHRYAHYTEILQIDKEICDFRASLPSHFRSNLTPSGDAIEESDKELDEAFPFLFVHRFLIETEINFLRTTLHRPYLLRSSQGSRYLPSRTACIEAAHHDIVLRVSFVGALKASFAPKPVSKAYQVQIGHSKWFSSLLICGIALVLDPHSAKAPTLRNHLQHYFNTVGKKLQQLRAEGEHAKDEMRERETSILKLFMKKSDELRAQPPAAPAPAPASASNEANGKGKKRENQADDGRSLKRGRPSKGSFSSVPEDEGDNAAGLLLGLGQKGVSSPLNQTSHRYSTSTSSQSHNGSPLVSRSSAVTEQSPASGAEHAQDLFDAWYRAEFAAGGSVSDNFGYLEGGGNGLAPWLTQPQSVQGLSCTLNPPFFGSSNSSNPAPSFAFSSGGFGSDQPGQNEINMLNFASGAVPFENMSLQALQQQQQRRQPNPPPAVEQPTNSEDKDGGDFWHSLIEKITN